MTTYRDFEANSFLSIALLIKLPETRMSSPLPSRLLPLPSKPLPPANSAAEILHFPPDGHYSAPTRVSRFKCSAGQPGFFTKLGRLIKEKAKSDVEKIFSGFSKTRDNLAVVDELLLYWNLSDTDRVLDELEEVQDFSFFFLRTILPLFLSTNYVFVLLISSLEIMYNIGFHNVRIIGCRIPKKV